MKARPILFSAPMIRALLEGRKTQTRRVAKDVATVHARTGEALAFLDSAGPRVSCPYGKPGDLLWVREAVCTDWADKPVYKADDQTGRGAREAGYPKEPKYRPSIHMPRSASRLTLRITDVRVQRLQDISGDDCIAEGVWRVEERELGRSWEAIDAYSLLWESINGPGSWDANPWVWALTFEVIKANVDEVLS